MRKKIFSIWSVLLILVVSIAVLVPGCDGAGETYDLTMAVSPVGSGTATDLTGTSPYTALTAVNISAVAAAGYQFVDWTAPAGLFANANAAQTTFIMPAQNVTVTAHFVGPLDHFTCYWVEDAVPPIEEDEVYVDLEDQFVAINKAMVDYEGWFCNPVAKDHDGLTPISNPDHHFTVYSIYYNFEEEAVARSVEVSNQFDPFDEPQQLSVWGPVGLVVPTQKLEPGDHELPRGLDHFLLYVVEDGQSVGKVVVLNDQFGGEPDAMVYEPVFFANPVKKTDATGVTEIKNDDHLVFYDIGIEEQVSYTQAQIHNQFGEQSLNVSTPAELLAVPSEKIVPPTPLLDHFKCYKAGGLPLEGVAVYLEDQFGYFYDAQVLNPMMFCNPVDKLHGTVETSSNPDNHLTVYKITTYEEPDWWTVTVDNQFNDAAAPQTLIVTGPVALAVPTQKVTPGDHGMPKYIDHYLLYEVWEGLNVTATVDLNDQFDGNAPNVEVTKPVYFANPVVKGYIDHAGLWDPEEHLVFYAISDNDEFSSFVTIKNQFFWEEPVSLDLIPIEQLLAVPSVKVDWAPTESPIG